MNSLREHTQFIHRKARRQPLLEAFLRDHIRGNRTVRVGLASLAHRKPACLRANDEDASLLLIGDALVHCTREGCGRPVYGLAADSSASAFAESGQSDLETTLDSGVSSGWMRDDPVDLLNVVALLDRFKNAGISKHNWFADEFSSPKLPERAGILLDVHESGFDRAISLAFDMTADDPIYLLGNAEKISRLKLSHPARHLTRDRRVKLLSSGLSPGQYFPLAHSVVVGNSLMGMEALIHGKKVITCGSPFYAGRGLTEDLNPVLKGSSRRQIGLPELFKISYLQYCHYFDPDTGAPCRLDDIISHIELQKERFRENSGLSLTVGFSPWKRKVVAGYLQSPSGNIRHVKAINKASHDCRVLSWGRNAVIPDEIKKRAICVEDGFIRSKGLGAAFNFPYSWVMDKLGIYFDSSAPSDLETIFNQGFTEAELAESRVLIGMLRENRMTKYNLGTTPIHFDRSSAVGRKVILVPGQVEADASILYGSPIVKSNLELLKAVRRYEPDAFLIFKAHPDLVASARNGKILSGGIEAVADLVVTDGNVLDWLDQCDEVHTMTSTVGFEALIRNVPVVTHGMPFYGGWGLTKDHLRCDRRTRTLALEELVYGALIKYPNYLNPATGEFTTALKVVRLFSSTSNPCAYRSWYLKVIFCMKRARVRFGRI